MSRPIGELAIPISENPEWVLGVKQGIETFNTGGIADVIQTLECWADQTGIDSQSESVPIHIHGYATVVTMWQEGRLN